MVASHLYYGYRAFVDQIAPHLTRPVFLPLQEHFWQNDRRRGHTRPSIRLIGWLNWRTEADRLAMVKQHGRGDQWGPIR